jgi:hypothetical protein
MRTIEQVKADMDDAKTKRDEHAAQRSFHDKAQRIQDKKLQALNAEMIEIYQHTPTAAASEGKKR